MQFAEFHNALRIMLSLDRGELERAGIIEPGNHNAWGAFRRDPFRWFVKADDEQAMKLWKLIERRQPAPAQQGEQNGS